MSTANDMPLGYQTIKSCTCGRALDRPHCVKCGLQTCYAAQKHSRIETTPQGLVRIQGYVCRTCGHIFDASSVCAAPPPKRAAAATRDELTKSVMAMPKVKRDKKLTEAEKVVKKLLERREAAARQAVMDGTVREEEQEQHPCTFCGANSFDKLEDNDPNPPFTLLGYRYYCHECHQEYR